MIRKVSITNKDFHKGHSIAAKIFTAAFISTTVLGVLSTQVFAQTTNANETEKAPGYQINYKNEFVTLETIDFDTQSIQTAQVKKEQIIEEQRLQAQKEEQIKAQEQLKAQQNAQMKTNNVAIINNYLKSQRSPIANSEIPALIYDMSLVYKYDYKVLIALMGLESGFCAQSYHYNCFGYINGAQYNSYEDAFKDLIPKVNSQYLSKYGTDFTGLAKAYGMKNWEKGATFMQKYYNAF